MKSRHPCQAPSDVTFSFITISWQRILFYTIFFDLKLGSKALLWVALEPGHHFPESGTAREHMCCQVYNIQNILDIVVM